MSNDAVKQNIGIPILPATVDGELLNEDKIRELAEHIKTHRLVGNTNARTRSEKRNKANSY